MSRDVELATPSTGDPERDQQTLTNFQRHDALIQAGKCPNGCGAMKEQPGEKECLKCGFLYTFGGGFGF